MGDWAALADYGRLVALRSQRAMIRDKLARDVADALGPDWVAQVNPVSGSFSPALRHRPTELDFLVIPGGTMTMGVTSEDLERVRVFVGNHGLKVVERYRSAAMPAHGVCIGPFLCSRELVSLEDFARLFPGTPTSRYSEYADVERSVALHLVASLGFRLPSDAELEWLARDTQQYSFVLGCAVDAPTPDDPDDDEILLVNERPVTSNLGVLDLFRPQWAADDWFASHAGASNTSEPRVSGDPQGVLRFERFDYRELGEEALAWELSARREPGKGLCAGVRLALSLSLP